MNPAWARLREAAALVCSYDQSKYRGAVLGATLAVDLLREALKRVDAEPQQPDEARERAIEEWKAEAMAMPFRLVIPKMFEEMRADKDCFYIHRSEILDGVALMRSAPAQQPVPEDDSTAFTVSGVAFEPVSGQPPADVRKAIDLIYKLFAERCTMHPTQPVPEEPKPGDWRERFDYFGPMVINEETPSEVRMLVALRDGLAALEARVAKLEGGA